MADKIKIVLTLLIVAAGIGAFYYLGEQPAAVKAAILLVTAIVAVLVFYQTAPGRATWDFLKAARGELRKVVWPNNKETVQVTLVVFAMAVVVAIFLWVVDWGLLRIVRALTGQGA